MQLNTRHFGTIEIDEKGIIDFPEGIPGFENVKKFILLGSQDEGSPFQWLQSVDKPELAFIIIEPKAFKPDYVVDVEDKEVEILDIKDTNQVLIYSIVVIPDDVSKMTANLKAPLIINTENNRGKQVTMEQGEYQVRHYIMDELRKLGGHE
ncbi:MAG: flagellar assembly protein FliW [Clostridia bacterium]|nr:flagellar assembly protein FliW [Clostridia bacterium]